MNIDKELELARLNNSLEELNTEQLKQVNHFIKLLQNL